MAKQLTFSLVLVLVSAVSFSADNADELQRKIDTINQQSLNLLGISLTALLYLEGASPDSYLNYEYLKQTGKINDIKELERKGYVTLEATDQLPDGQRVGKQLRIIPTVLGNDARKCIQNITTASKRTLKSGAQ